MVTSCENWPLTFWASSLVNSIYSIQSNYNFQFLASEWRRNVTRFIWLCSVKIMICNICCQISVGQWVLLENQSFLSDAICHTAEAAVAVENQWQRPNYKSKIALSAGPNVKKANKVLNKVIKVTICHTTVVENQRHRPNYKSKKSPGFHSRCHIFPHLLMTKYHLHAFVLRVHLVSFRYFA